MIDGPCHAQRLRFEEHLIVPARLVVGVQQDVRVRVDEPGQERHAGEIDLDRAAGGDGRRGTGRLDARAADEDRPAVAHGLAVEDSGWFEQIRGRCRLRGATRAPLRGERSAADSGQRERDQTSVTENAHGSKKA